MTEPLTGSLSFVWLMEVTASAPRRTGWWTHASSAAEEARDEDDGENFKGDRDGGSLTERNPEGMTQNMAGNDDTPDHQSEQEKGARAARFVS